MKQSSIILIAVGTIALIVLVILGTWALGGFADLSPAGGVALVLGITISTGLGIGLMALVFYSSRSEQDDAVYMAASKRETAGSKPFPAELRRR
jgi:hypothetical protein